jgi:hypothetical protein
MTTTYSIFRAFLAHDDPRLGRHVHHDSRSLNYRKDTSGLSVSDVEWATHLTAILDQGDVGSCTAETGDELMASDPYYATLPILTQTSVASASQAWPLALYHDETVVDSYPGTYPPDDTGSDGLTMAKVLKTRGLISGYEHTFTADDALKALSTGPAAWGTNWKTGMDDVNTTTGQVKYTGDTRGGHELSLYKIVASAEQLWFRNHWGAWGYQNSGVAWISFSDFEKSLADQGDVTWLTPITSPAPIPTPTPVPPTPGPTDVDAALVKAGNAWESTVLSRLTKAGRLRTAFDAWKNANGYH